MRSPFFKQTTCGFPGCKKKSERRVTLKMSEQLFSALSEHIPIGAGLNLSRDYSCFQFCSSY